MIYWLLIAVAIGIALVFAVALSAKGTLPKAGAAAPEFTLPDQNGVMRTLSEFRGRWLTLYFYPRDDTPTCSEQAARFRDAMVDLESLGAAVCGISVDDSASHAAFARKYKLPFALLADRDGSVAAHYGSLLNLLVIKFARRNTFLIDPQGNVAKTYVGVSAASNAQDVMHDLKAYAAH